MNPILRMPDVVKLVGMCRASIYKAIKADNFPQPVRLGARSVGWRQEEVEDWLADRPKGVGAQPASPRQSGSGS